MDILNPQLIWIENRCYRKLPIKGSEKTVYIEDDLYPDEGLLCSKEYDEEDALPIMQELDKFWISITVPGPLIGMVKGKKNNTVNRIRDSTSTVIKFPSVHQNHQTGSRSEQSVDVVITGAKRTSVSDAYRRIEGIINDGRWKVADYTHFVSIPMNSDTIQEGFLKFKEDILQNFKHVHGINEFSFVHPATLHLTVVMLTLFDSKEKEVAKAELNKARSAILQMLGNKTLCVQMKGIEYMNDDPGDVDVLYGKVQEIDGDNLLQIIANKIADSLISGNLARREYDSVKLHVTLMRSRSKDGERLSFDARPLLKRYSDYLFGETTIKEIHISIRKTGDRAKYYTSSSYISL